MHRSSILWLLCAATASGCVVATKKEPTTHRTVRNDEPPPSYEPPPPRRDDPPPPRRDDPPPRREWDPSGWTLLGEQWVEGTRDTDVIRVGRREGAFTKLMVYVEESDVEIHDMIVHFDNGRTQSPQMKHNFRDGQRTRPIDLRGEARVITKIELKYRNVPGGGRAKVAVYGKSGDVAGPEPRPRPDPRPRPPSWDNRGWTLLGEQTVQGGRDSDYINVGAREGAFTKLMIVVEEGDMKLNDIIVEFDNGRTQSPQAKHNFTEGSRTRPIDLRGDARVIKRVQLKYGNIKGGAQARVQLWGKQG